MTFCLATASFRVILSLSVSFRGPTELRASGDPQASSSSPLLGPETGEIGEIGEGAVPRGRETERTRKGKGSFAVRVEIDDDDDDDDDRTDGRTNLETQRTDHRDYFLKELSEAVFRIDARSSASVNARERERAGRGKGSKGIVRCR